MKTFSSIIMYGEVSTVCKGDFIVSENGIIIIWTSMLLALAIADSNLPPSCDRKVYCDSDLLHYVQLSRIYPDSKTFVDFRLLKSENETLAAFTDILISTSGKPSDDKLKLFISEHFADGGELEDWMPTDHTENPAFINQIKDEKLRQFGKDVNSIWPKLGRKVSVKVFKSPELYSLIPVSHGFIIPGGRFKELYYWDSYWIIEGLLVCGMTETARGMIDNLLELVNKLGHVPNGARVYYNERSQPPLLAAMAQLYMKATKDRDWLQRNIGLLEKELEYWFNKQAVTFSTGEQEYTLIRYFAESQGPRPESYYEDYKISQIFNTNERRQEFYVDIKSAAESGWDFSSRWFIDSNGANGGNLTNVRTRRIIPVDLNAIFAGALQIVGDFQAQLGDHRSAVKWWLHAKYWRLAINEVLWSMEDGIWFDYDIDLQKHRKFFYPSNVAPLWAGAVEKPLVRVYARRIVSYLTSSKGLSFEGGVPTSLSNTGEQWDFPNAWPPLESMMIGALEATGTRKGKRLALNLANLWIRSNYKGFNDTKVMFEKYDAVQPGEFGSGGEYTVQEGFGWSNGVVLELLGKYGSKLTLAGNLRSLADPQDNTDSDVEYANDTYSR